MSSTAVLGPKPEMPWVMFVAIPGLGVMMEELLRAGGRLLL